MTTTSNRLGYFSRSYQTYPVEDFIGIFFFSVLSLYYNIITFCRRSMTMDVNLDVLDVTADGLSYNCLPNHSPRNPLMIRVSGNFS
jgi:hypothetical protein